MAANDIVTVQIDTTSPGLTQAGFGRPMVAAYHTAWPELTRLYTSADDMLTDGFTALSPAYLAVQQILAQSPRVPDVLVGRLATPYTQVHRLTPVGVVNGAVFKVTVTAGSTVVTATHTATGISTVASVCTALVAALGVIPTLTIVDAGTHITITGTVGTTSHVRDLTRATLQYQDLTPDPGITADLAAILNADQSWYGLIVMTPGVATLTAAAAWAESQRVLHFAQTSDHQAFDTLSSIDLGAALKALSRRRTAFLHTEDTSILAACSLMGIVLPTRPGEATAANKTLSGVPVAKLTASQLAALRGKNYVTYRLSNGVSHTLDGKVAIGEFIDFIRFVDWLAVRIQERILLAQFSNPKIPYTAKGLSLIEGLIRAQLLEGVSVGGINGDEPITVTVPTLASIPAIDKQNRVLNNVTFSAVPAGAIHFVEIRGTVAF